jgi:hypothetical protein
MDLQPTIEQLDREIEKKRHSETLERQDVTIGLLAQLEESISTLNSSIEDGASKTGDAISSLSEDIRGIKIETPNVSVTVPDVNVPEIKVPDITVNVPEVKLPTITVPEITIPEIKLPTINVPKPEVTVNVPEIKIPTIKVPKIEMPDKMTIKGDVGLKDVDKTHPLPVTVVGPDGGPIGSSGGGKTDFLTIKEVKGQVGVIDYFTLVARGLITGQSALLKFGRNPDIDQTVEETVWEGGGVYPFPATAVSLEVVSSDADDTAAGTGARTITLIGQDSNNNEKTATITLNGVGAVAIPGTWLRVYRCSVTTAGTSAVNEGTLTIRDAGGGTTRLVVGANNGQTLMAVYTVPSGKTAYMLSYYASSNALTASYVDIKLITRTSAGVINLKHQQAESSGLFKYMFSIPFAIPEKNDIYINAVSSANNTDVCAGFDILLINN